MSLEEHIAEVAAANPGVRIDCYVLFSSHTDAMQMYDCLRGAKLNARVSTTPRQARSSCGVAVLVPSNEALQVEEVAIASGIPYEGIVALPCQIDPKRDVYC